MTEQTSYTFEDCIKKCESIIDGIYQDGCQSIHLYSLKTFIYGMVDIHNKTTIELQDEVNQFRAIGTIEEFKALKEKSVAKKAEVNEFDYGEGYVCGECESFLHYVDDDDEHIRTNYCCHCGTKIDWQ